MKTWPRPSPWATIWGTPPSATAVNWCSRRSFPRPFPTRRKAAGGAGAGNCGRGLNLTFEVRDGIVKHSKGYGKIMPDDPGELPGTMEGRVVRVADIMAYLNHDLDDAIRSGVIREAEIRGSAPGCWERPMTNGSPP
jgi:hypothetical protein